MPSLQLSENEQTTEDNSTGTLLTLLLLVSQLVPPYKVAMIEIRVGPSDIKTHRDHMLRLHAYRLRVRSD